MDLRILDAYQGRSKALDLEGIDWAAVRSHPLPAPALRVLHYMQDIEIHTLIYLRELLATRAIDEPGVGDFLACWIFEETAHGRALQRFLEASGEVVERRPRARGTLAERFEERMISLVSGAWKDFVGVHMTWGAINELTTLQGYNRLADRADHPVLSELLGRIARDESRHFSFYFHQARRWLSRPRVAPMVRLLLRSFWTPVGNGRQPDEETLFLAEYLFSGEEGRRAARKVDQTIRTLPGLEGMPLLDHWLERHAVA
jgi:rubrerythrin